MATATTLHDIRLLLASRHPLVVLESVEEDRLRTLVRAAADGLAMPMFEWSVTQGLRRADERDTSSGITAHPSKLLAHLAGMSVRAVFLACDLHPHLDDPTTTRQVRELIEPLARMGATLVMSGAEVTLPPEIEADVVRLRVALPAHDELATMLHALIASTGAIVEPGTIEPAIEAVHGLTLNQARQAAAAVLVNGVLEAGDLRQLVDRKVRVIAEGGMLEYFPASDNDAELAGLSGLKRWLSRAAVAFTADAQALNIAPPRGVLLAGVPGCGKSLAAKYIARRWERPLLKLDAASLYDKYVGESERNLRTALEMAETLAPIVLWIDEIEKGLATGGDDAGGATSRRMMGTLLTWMQEQESDCFVVATCNDLTALPPELQRKGRFDEVFFVDLPTPEERQAIFATQLASRRQDPRRFDMGALVAASSEFSGAEIEQVVVSGLLRAMHVRRRPSTAALLAELRETVPLARSRPDAIATVRARARDFVPAS